MLKASPESAPALPADAATKNFISSDVTLEGQIETVGNLIFDGTLKGAIRGGPELIIGQNARIEGDISAQSITIYGHVTGNVNAFERTLLKNGSALHGDLISKRLSMEEGVIFVGSSKVSSR